MTQAFTPSLLGRILGHVKANRPRDVCAIKLHPAALYPELPAQNTVGILCREKDVRYHSVYITDFMINH